MRINRLPPEDILRALSRFDWANTEDVGLACGCSTANQRRKVWGALQNFVENGLATKRQTSRNRVDYQITQDGREKLARLDKEPHVKPAESARATNEPAQRRTPRVSGGVAR